MVNVLNNEVYLGKIRWRREPVKRVIKNGIVAKKRIQNDDYDLYDGRHEAIITQEQWDAVPQNPCCLSTQGVFRAIMPLLKQ